MCREFLQRFTSNRARASNPDCEVTVDLKDDLSYRPVIKAVYGACRVSCFGDGLACRVGVCTGALLRGHITHSSLLRLRSRAENGMEEELDYEQRLDHLVKDFFERVLLSIWLLGMITAYDLHSARTSALLLRVAIQLEE